MTRRPGNAPFSALLAVGAVVAGCDSPTPSQAPATTSSRAPATRCLADRGGPLRAESSPHPDCSVTDLACRDDCLAGDAAACYQRATALEESEDGKSEAFVLYHRSCELGLAIGCTNYGAAVWATASAATDTACARRLFARSCDAGESFGCGMHGRMVLDEAKGADDVARGREILERSCEELRGFPCRVLAKHLESEERGRPDAARVRDLLRRACDGGDEDACGDHDTALETFSE